MAKRTKLRVVKRPRPDYSGRSNDDLLWEAAGLHYYGWKEDAQDILMYLAEQVKDDDDVEKIESVPPPAAHYAPASGGGQAWWKWN